MIESRDARNAAAIEPVADRARYSERSRRSALIDQYDRKRSRGMLSAAAEISGALCRRREAHCVMVSYYGLRVIVADTIVVMLMLDLQSGFRSLN